jgi:hypothetical protein
VGVAHGAGDVLDVDEPGEGLDAWLGGGWGRGVRVLGLWGVGSWGVGVVTGAGAARLRPNAPPAARPPLTADAKRLPHHALVRAAPVLPGGGEQAREEGEVGLRGGGGRERAGRPRRTAS